MGLLSWRGQGPPSRRVVACLKAGVRRPADLVARYGGEEFVALLPETDLIGAMLVARNLGAAVHALQIEHADSAVAPLVTVSLGVCSRSSCAPGLMGGGIAGSAAALLLGADAQLYVAKSSGRHRSCGAEMAVI